MTYLTLGEAEKEVGVTKSTISRAIKDGRMSANRNEHGHYQIDPAELFRVYPPLRKTEDEVEHPSNSASRNRSRNTVQHHATPDSSDDDHEMTHWLRERLERTEEKLAQTEATLDEREDALRELREAYRALPSPEDVEARIQSVRTEMETEKLKAVAVQKQQQEKDADMWKATLAARKREILKAREEARVVSERSNAERIAREALSQQVADLESRSFFARLFNRKVTMG